MKSRKRKELHIFFNFFSKIFFSFPISPFGTVRLSIRISSHGRNFPLYSKLSSILSNKIWSHQKRKYISYLTFVTFGRWWCNLLTELRRRWMQHIIEYVIYSGSKYYGRFLGNGICNIDTLRLCTPYMEVKVETIKNIDHYDRYDRPIGCQSIWMDVDITCIYPTHFRTNQL